MQLAFKPQPLLRFSALPRRLRMAPSRRRKAKKKKGKSSACFLPEDLLIKILTRVPPKSLIKFKCVSKPWNSLISGSHFVSLQMHHALTISNLPSPRLLIRCLDEILFDETYTVYNDQHDNKANLIFKESITVEHPFNDTSLYCYSIVGSCNGVLCLSHGSRDHDDIHLWNPAIKRRLKVPTPRLTSIDRCAVGFGFDVVNNDYKVVRLVYGEGENGLTMAPKVEVYSLSLRNWREINVVEYPSNCVLKQFRRRVFVNGNLHWVACRNDEENVERSKNFVMRFDISLEVFDEMSLPEALEHHEVLVKPTVIRESLAVCQQDQHGCSIWVLNKYGDVKSWSKMYSVGLSRVGTVYGLRMNGDILLSDWSRGLVSYNLETGACVELEISGKLNSFFVLSYVESLALLNAAEAGRGRVSRLRRRERLS